MSTSAVERAIGACTVSQQLVVSTTLAIRRSRAARLERASFARKRAATRAAHLTAVRDNGLAVARLGGALDDGHRSTTLLRAVLHLRTVPEHTEAFPATVPASRELPATVRRAKDFIEQNAHLPITATDVATASFVTLRAVQIAFQRHLSMTPLEYLRSVRLARARGDLLAGPAANAYTVTAVAERWHFSNTGRFGAYYRAVYGEAPKDTLYRTRRGADTTDLADPHGPDGLAHAQ